MLAQAKGVIIQENLVLLMLPLDDSERFTVIDTTETVVSPDKNF